MSSCRNRFVDNEPLFERLADMKFDLAVVDGIFMHKCLYLIPHRLGLPVVSFTDVIDPLLVRIPWLPSFVPNDLSTFTDRLSFVERLQNAIMMLAFSFIPVIPDAPEEVCVYQLSSTFN
jgi:UDP-glucoronosyl and UDP-glucosyl transferase